DYTIPINRQQMAKMISMALRENIEVDAEALQKEIKDFDSISEEYKNVILRVYAAGIVGGTTDGEFNPLGIATRAEAAAMLERLLDTSKRLRAVTAQSSVPENPNYVIPSPFNHAIDGDSVEIPGITSKSEKGTIWTYPAYDQADKSPDYEVTLQQGGGDAVDSFAFYSFKQPSYNMHNMEGEVMRSYASTIENREAHSNTTTIFSFEGGPITVRVKVKPGAKNITLPLTSAKVLPSSYNIPCKIENSDTIVFTLDRPEKFFVIPNYDTVWNKYTELAKEHTTVQKWQDFSTQMNEPNFKGKNLTVEEGFLNPIVIVAHEKENVSYIPDKAGSKVLMVKPGDLLTQEKISEHDVIWFTPGVHDLSNLGTNPEHEVYIREGQTVYLEGGSYVMARFYSKDDTDKGMAYIVGRGILSGRNHKWVNLPNMCPLLDLFDEVNGITMTEPSGVAILRTKKVVDTALVGTWHYNITGIITTNGCVVENCLFMSDDDNVVLQTNVSMKHIVIWQQSNAHPMMEQGNAGRDYANTSVEDVDIIAYFRFPSPQPWHQVGLGAIAVIRGTHYSLENFSFKDIRIESPYLFRAFTVYNLNTNIINPGWFSATTEKDHSRIKGLTFENITVTSPIIFMTSLVGSPYEDSMENVLFKNIVINGAVVDETNLSKYIEVDGNLKGIRFEK
ncbi:MAG: S-layer homology domain-containing protein, partial [Firmicutes bacterium]|nr:S-layer homology domain-containing protein [Bacillota bacterium]